MVKKMNPEELEKLIDSMGGIEEVSRSMEQPWKDFVYFDTYHQELLKSYPEEWVAVYNEEVVEHDKDYLTLISRIDNEVRRHAVLQHVTARKRPLILVGV